MYVSRFASLQWPRPANIRATTSALLFMSRILSETPICLSIHVHNCQKFSPEILHIYPEVPKCRHFGVTIGGETSCQRHCNWGPARSACPRQLDCNLVSCTKHVRIETVLSASLSPPYAYTHIHDYTVYMYSIYIDMYIYKQYVHTQTYEMDQNVYKYIYICIYRYMYT